jgi:two-component system OmpR family response regulator
LAKKLISKSTSGRLIALLNQVLTVEKHTDDAIDVLIVEDEIDICFLLTGILRRKSLRTSYVNSIQAASKVLEIQNPSILFLDNNLPDGCGVDSIRDMKNGHPLMTIIMITADDSPVNRNNALKAGADFFIGKPFTTDAINKTIDVAMQSV